MAYPCRHKNSYSIAPVSIACLRCYGFVTMEPPPCPIAVRPTGAYIRVRFNTFYNMPLHLGHILLAFSIGAIAGFLASRALWDTPPSISDKEAVKLLAVANVTLMRRVEALSKRQATTGNGSTHNPSYPGARRAGRETDRPV